MFRLLYARYGDDPKILHTLADRTMPEIIWSEASKALLVGVLVELIRYLLHLERASQTFELQLLSIAVVFAVFFVTFSILGIRTKRVAARRLQVIEHDKH